MREFVSLPCDYAPKGCKHVAVGTTDWKRHNAECPLGSHACKHAAHGCKEIVMPARAFPHARVCPHRVGVCPMLVLNAKRYACKVPIVQKELRQHLVDAHNIKPYLTNNGEFDTWIKPLSGAPLTRPAKWCFFVETPQGDMLTVRVMRTPEYLHIMAIALTDDPLRVSIRVSLQMPASSSTHTFDGILPPICAVYLSNYAPSFLVPFDAIRASMAMGGDDQRMHITCRISHEGDDATDKLLRNERAAAVAIEAVRRERQLYRDIDRARGYGPRVSGSSGVASKGAAQ